MSVAEDALAPWQQRVYERVASAHAAGTLGHAMLFCGPALLGKRAVADRLARHVLGADMPGRAAQLFDAGTHPDLDIVSFILNKEGTRLRGEIVIEQIRELSAKLALTPQYRGAQIAIVDPADAVNNAAYNGLLKTLEEPRPGRYLWLLSADPARLPATIRSRCQRLEFVLPPRDEALQWLGARGHKPADVAEALDAARGHPGLADAWLRDGGMALRRDVAADLARLRSGDAAVVDTAQRWTRDDDTALRLRHAADLALSEAGGLTDTARMRKLSTWFDAANRTRDLLRTTVRADLAVAELLLAWRGNERPVPASGARRRS